MRLRLPPLAGICMISGVNLANRVFPVYEGISVGICIFVNGAPIVYYWIC